MTNQTELRVIELTEIVEGETEPLYDHTIQYRNDGGQWTSLPVVRVFDRDTYEMMQNGDDSKWKELGPGAWFFKPNPSPEAIVKAALERAVTCCEDELRNTAMLLSNPPKSSAAWDAANSIRKLASDPTEVAAIIKKAGEDRK